MRMFSTPYDVRNMGSRKFKGTWFTKHGNRAPGESNVTWFIKHKNMAKESITWFTKLGL
jgi:hypothetical protein